MKGHYYIELDSGYTIVESSLSVAVAKAMARPSKPVCAAFVCSYGCGNLHPLTNEDYGTLSETERNYLGTAAEGDES